MDVASHPSVVLTALRPAWRLLPQRLRRHLFRIGTRLLAPLPPPEADVRPGPAAVVGMLTSTTGLGHGARLCLDALHRAGFEVRHGDMSRALSAQDLPSADFPGRPAGGGEGGLLIVHLNPHVLPFAMMVLGKARLRAKRVVGYWAWELPAVPPRWKRTFRFVHEIWVPSRFTAEAFGTHPDPPIRVVPHPVVRPRPPRQTRADLGLPEEPFLALTMFHMGSGYARKNPVGAVRAFRAAFGARPDVMLVVKVVGGDDVPWAMEDLRRAIGGAPNIRIVTDRLPQAGMDSLMHHADVILSLHRAEGFGLPLAQGMMLGKPVIATGWSGNTDFMSAGNSILVDYELVPVRDPQGSYPEGDQKWAEPDTEQAADWLVRLAESPDLGREIGRAAAEFAATRFSLSSYLDAIGPSLELVRRRTGVPAGTEVA